MPVLDVCVGMIPWSLTVPADRRVELRRAPIVSPAGSAGELTRAALEHPHGFEAMRRAITPDDRVTVVLDPTLPQIGPILAEVLAHLASGGVQAEAVTILTPPGSSQSWIEDLPDEVADVRTEIHDPAERQKLAYLATTQGERRVYLNRTLVDADFVAIVSGRGYDPLTGYAGAEAAVFPALSNDETRETFAGQLSVNVPKGEPWPARAEAQEVVALLGLPFLVQVIEGAGGTIQEVVAGLASSSDEGIRRHDSRWRATASEEPDTVIAAVGGDPARITFEDIAKAAACAARVARKGGRIAVLAAAAPELGAGAQLLRSMDGPTGARKLLARLKPDDWAAALLWSFAAKNHSICLASGYPDDVAEELFATPIRTASEVQRLIDGGEKVLVIPDADKSMVSVDTNRGSR